MKRTFLVLLCAFCFQYAYTQGYTPDNLPDVKLRDANAYVNNKDGVLSSTTEMNLNLLLRNLQDSTTVDVAVVVVNAIDPQYDIDEFATLLFTKWGIGAKNDNGLLFLMVMNDRKMVFRTGYGLEGSLPDVVLGRIIRDDIAPLMKAGHTDDAVSAGIMKVAALLYNPTLRDELYSEDNAPASKRSFFEQNPVYAALSFIIGGLCILFFIWVLCKNTTSYAKFQLFNKVVPAIVILLFIFPVTMLVLNIVFFIIRRVLRKRAPRCRQCHNKMIQVFDPDRIRYLTPIQDCESRIKSVNYDVWKCSCGQVENLAYSRLSSYIKCPHCSAKAYYIQASKVQVYPTYSTTGSGIRTYNCKYCNRTDQKTYTIPRKQRASSGGSSGGSFGGGSFGGGGGGSRGGGRTGGGGASGGW